MSKEVECPYCEHENDLTEYLTDVRGDEFDHECESCEREFEIHVAYEPSLCSSEIVYENCQSCGDKTREPYKKGKVFPYPKHVEHDVICKSCWLKAYREELDSEFEAREVEHA
ncbi:hypothetical protein EBB07_00875 [Paenibacillaceae bacterium]|nr:hypothetical protein EBB07_00875 [Paenibacillaceae bacterium]